jgi:hypothetical protein
MTLRPSFGEARTLVEVEIDEQVKSRVLNGIALLKEKHGEKWVEKIDLASFDISEGYSCVLGQVYGQYEKGLNKLRLYDNHAIEYGFNLDDVDYGDGDDYDDKFEEEIRAWNVLQETWVRELAAIGAR